MIVQNLEDGFWVCVDVWGELNVYIHMYATLAMGGNQQSHKQIDESRPWVMRMYYSNAYVLFLVCTLNVLFFIASYLLSSSSPTLMPSLSEVSQATRPWIGAMEMARVSKIDSTVPWILLAASSLFMLFKQYVNVV